ncbi:MULTISPECIES: DUF4435 domain-containing protein [unclassified Methylobacterium]|uniref:DUF4435 domain-containing protein n=3 Tax=Methylobacterium TaxID=407 RepID=UPI00165032D8|nr:MULTISPECIES: DUF4435 domain-containing protein [unclassified Methylobacterium]
MAAYAALYSTSNDIDIYVEDRTLVGLYEMIVRKVFGGAIRLAAVTPLGSKANVVREALRLQNDGARKRFFLVDGDFDWFSAGLAEIKDLYYLNCYSIENFAWHYAAVLDTAKILAPEKSHAEIVQSLPATMFATFESDIKPLFILYAICMRMNATCETVGYSLIRLIDRQKLVVDNRLLINRIREIYLHLRTLGSLADIKRARSAVINELLQKGAVDSRLISGKDYLMQFLLLVMQSKYNFRGNSRQLASMIINQSDLTVDPRLKHELLARMPK